MWSRLVALFDFVVGTTIRRAMLPLTVHGPASSLTQSTVSDAYSWASQVSSFDAFAAALLVACELWDFHYASQSTRLDNISSEFFVLYHFLIPHTAVGANSVA